jgi:lipoprotein NlpI
LGQLSESEFLKAANNDSPKKDKEQHCEAYYYAGERRVVDGDVVSALGLFQKCIETGEKTFQEFRSARSELDLREGAH